MSQRDLTVPLHHMLDHAQEAIQMAGGRTRQDLDRDRQLNLSLVHLLEIVGEAAGRIPKEEQARHLEIPWPEIISLRNRLIHGYDQVDFDVLWTIIAEDLPPLVKSLKKILG
jgi:uncharacterized protein with HEPN domain